MGFTSLCILNLENADKLVCRLCVCMCVEGGRWEGQEHCMRFQQHIKYAIENSCTSFASYHLKCSINKSHNGFSSTAGRHLGPTTLPITVVNAEERERQTKRERESARSNRSMIIIRVFHEYLSSCPAAGTSADALP